MMARTKISLLVISMLVVFSASLSGLAQTDSGTIIYARYHDYRHDFYAVAPDGSAERFLFESYDSDLAWSPDGKLVVYRQMRDGPAETLSMADYDLYLTDLTGLKPIQLTSTRTNGAAQWSPDGNWIVFVSGSFGLLEPRPSEFQDIYVLDVRVVKDGIMPESVQLTSIGTAWSPRWSPDSSRIAFLSNCDLFVMSVDGSHVRNLTEALADCVSSPDWSPMADQIAFQAANLDKYDVSSEIYVIDVDTLKLVQITNNAIPDQYPRWSPDGTRIAFVSNFGGIHLFNTDDTDLVNLTEETGISHIGFRGDFAWSPDGTKMVFSGKPADGTADQIFILDVETGDARLLAGAPYDELHYTNPVWLP